MAEKKKQHYVPQFYFKFFTKSNKINLLNLKSGEILLNKNIYDQCQGDYFYGNKNIEDKICEIEKKFFNFHRFLPKITKSNFVNFINSYRYELYLSILFQWRRTKSYHTLIKNMNDAVSSFYPQELKNNHEIHQKIIRIDDIKETEQFIPLITNLSIVLLRNNTNIPFIFGDTPVVFYNLLKKDIKNYGVTKLNSSGIMIFYPFSKQDLILLIDEKFYDLKLKNWTLINFVQDIHNINKLQLHNAFKTVYFSDEIKNNVIEYYNQEKDFFLPLKDRSVINDLVNLNGINDFYFKQLPYQLNLSFINKKNPCYICGSSIPVYKCPTCKFQ